MCVRKNKGNSCWNVQISMLRIQCHQRDPMQDDRRMLRMPAILFLQYPSAWTING